MNGPSRQELALMLVWAFREQQVETAATPHADALTLYHNVMALPVDEAAAVVSCARSGNIPPSDPLMLARWTRGLCLLRDLIQQPMCELEITKLAQSSKAPSASAA
jgi:hypothetical protein